MGELMNFKESLKDGAMGEHVVWNLFMKMDNVRNVIDVRDDKFFQEADVDFLVEKTNRQFTWIEVKTDFKAHETGNIVYELSSSGNMGCLEKSKAKYVVFYLPHSETAYLVDLKALRAYIYSEHPKIVKGGDNAECILIKINDLLNRKIIVQSWKGVR